MDFEHVGKAVQCLYNYECVDDLDDAMRVVNQFYRVYRGHLEVMNEIEG